MEINTQKNCATTTKYQVYTFFKELKIYLSNSRCHGCSFIQSGLRGISKLIRKSGLKTAITADVLTKSSILKNSHTVVLLSCMQAKKLFKEIHNPAFHHSLNLNLCPSVLHLCFFPFLFFSLLKSYFPALQL